LSAFLPMQSLRAAGLHLIGSVGPLRRLAMREGLAPSWRTPHASRSVMETPAARSE
jgi:2-octaprenyl-6-methoxyphenol hydroxylase